MSQLVVDAGCSSAFVRSFGQKKQDKARIGTYSRPTPSPTRPCNEPDKNPPVIFLDPPMNRLDPQARPEVWHTVEQPASRGSTVLLTARYLDGAEHLDDRIAILLVTIASGIAYAACRLFLDMPREIFERSDSCPSRRPGCSGRTRSPHWQQTSFRS
ncbi:ATP-binding cassette domain-containing protein [Arthrobacter cheniae]|uniref:hypothetical protein n=1 Tax=Arthrobacter cheniae TaxID=1258888 RepID=UPI00160367BA